MKRHVIVLAVGAVLAMWGAQAAPAQDIKGCYEAGQKACNAGDYPKALEAWTAGLKLAEQANNDQARGAFLTFIGLVYEGLGPYDQALSYFGQALAIHRKLGDAKGEADDLGNIGNVYGALGQYDKALSYLGQVLAIHRKAGDLSGEGMDLCNIGNVYLYLAQYDQALSYFEQALAIQRKIGNVNGEGKDLCNIGNVYLHLGQYDQALSYFEKAVAIQRKIGDVSGEGMDLCNIGNVYLSLGQYDQALSYYEQALTIQRKIGDVRGEAMGLCNIGFVYENVGQYDQALSYFEQAFPIHQKIGDVRGEGADLCNIGVVCRELGQYDKALSYFEQALATFQGIGDAVGEGGDLHHMGSALIASGKPAEAEERLVAAADIYESIRVQLKSEEERRGFHSTLPEVYSGLAAARLKQGKADGAWEAIERGRAKTFLEMLAARAAGRGKAAEKTEEVHRLENELARLRDERVQVAMAPAGKKTRSVETVDKEISEFDRQRLEKIEQLRRADPELSSLAAVDPPQAKEIEGLLDKETALVEYWHAGEFTYAGKEKDAGGDARAPSKRDELWVFVVRADGVRFKAVKVAKKDLQAAAEKWAADLAENATKSAEAAQLHAWLIAPIQEEIASAKTIIVVPWGPLFKVPFAALAPEGGEALGASKNVVMAPSAGALRYLAQKRASGRGTLFALGNPKVEGMAALPGAEREADEIAALFPRHSVKVGEDATESLLKGSFDRLGRPDIVHLACHGILDERMPMFSRLMLAPDRANDGNLEMHELFGLDWKGVSLVTLSACSSGKGKLGAGNDLVGLTRGFMFAGAPSVLCSLWEVEDEPTRALMLAFYKNYLGGKSKPEALRVAQKAMRENPEHREWSHPYYWAAFTLWGDWE